MIRRLLSALTLAWLAGCSTAPSGQDWLGLPAGLVMASDAGHLKLPVAAAALAGGAGLDALVSREMAAKRAEKEAKAKEGARG